MRIHMEFVGDAAELIFLLMLTGFLFSLVLPGAWGAAIFLSWIARNTLLSPSVWVQFNGKGGEIAWAFILLFICYIGGCIPLGVVLVRNAEPLLFYVALGYFFIGILGCLFLWYMIIKWAMSSIEFSWGGQLKFQGKFRSLLWLTILFVVSTPLIIAPAWVVSLFIEWICHNSRSQMDDYLVWRGRGWGILWRTAGLFLSSLLLIPVPWALKWYIDYIISSIQVDRSPGMVREELRLASLELMIQ